MRPPPPSYPRRLIGNRYGGDTTAVICPLFRGFRREGLATPGDTGDTQKKPHALANHWPLETPQFDTLQKRNRIAEISNSRNPLNCYLAREQLEDNNNHNDLIGLDKPTGRGAFLPTKPNGELK